MLTPSTFHDDRVTLHHGDCLAVLDGLPENSVDSCCTDPPYHLQSIVRRFGADGSAPAIAGATGAYARASAGFMGRVWDGGDIAFQVDTWRKVLRVLKPGAYIIAFSSSRTFGRMSVAIEDAGFITHPMIGWLFGSGFPKATRIKADGYDGQRYGAQALKPALEPIYMGQKPFSEPTGTANILKWGTGAVEIDGCRIPTSEDLNGGTFSGELRDPGPQRCFENRNKKRGIGDFIQPLGRWPANLVTDGSPEVLAGFPDSGDSWRNNKGSGLGYGGGNGTDRLNAGHSDIGSAARFFYQTKADDDDRLGSRHPTVKPLDLMRWLVRLVTPKTGLVLDPFAGTGTTGHAALIEGMRAVLIEREAEYVADIERRMGLVYSGRDERARRLATVDDSPLPLFGGAA